MRKLIYLFLAFITFTSCKKDSPTTAPVAIDKGGIVQDQSPFTNSPSTLIAPPFTAQDSTIVQGLMTGNNLSSNGLVFYFYQSAEGTDPSNQPGFFQTAMAEQIRNGLPVFFDDIDFEFDNGKLTRMSDDAVDNSISLSNIPNLSLQALRSLFIKTDNAVEKITIQDSTLVAQLGYCNLNALTHPANFVKLWFVHPRHSAVPEGFFRDDTEAVYSFRPYTVNGPY